MNSNSSLPKDSGKEELLSRDVESLKLDETKDDDLMDVDHSDKGQLSHEPLKSNENSENDTNNKVLFGEDHMEGKTSSTTIVSIVYLFILQFFFFQYFEMVFNLT